MIVYNQAFDLYHTIFRFIQFLKKFNDGDAIELDRLRIWDFYLLFPSKIHDIRLKQNESEIRQIRKQFVRDSKNPYEAISEERKVFEKIKPYQLTALKCLASYGIIDKVKLNEDRVIIANKELLAAFVSKLKELSRTEQNVVSLMTSYFNQLSLFGPDGLKNRTDLIESKYDA